MLLCLVISDDVHLLNYLSFSYLATKTRNISNTMDFSGNTHILQLSNPGKYARRKLHVLHHNK